MSKSTVGEDGRAGWLGARSCGQVEVEPERLPCSLQWGKGIHP